MIILGILLAVLGYVLAIPILQTIGIVLVVAGPCCGSWGQWTGRLRAARCGFECTPA